jgi:Fe-S-cluster-containing hydrogenase component 2
MQKIRVEEDLCNGCLTCMAVCSTKNAGYSSPSSACLQIDLSLFGKNKIRICRQCPNAPCVKACPQQAIIRASENDPWLIDYGRCDGCGECIDACPFDAIFWDPLRHRVIKCDICGNTTPACVDACPTGALSVFEGATDLP